ncbi:MAG TPA: ATP-binding protein [Anaerolineaceae bacterium]|nr:ATP-binding protein [Anaerolineaceae bacterium]HPN51520.1 ATP-binding protein [Anaerolineaceae bacterium]
MSSDPNRQAYWLLKTVNQAIRDHQMIQPGDRVAVAVSGGKDSLSLLRLLQLRQRSSAGAYTLAAIHVLGDALGPAAAPHPPLEAWLAASGVPVLFAPLRLPEGETPPLNCQRCTWNRRRTLFEAAQRLDCNVIAFGHHADDLAQTTLMNLIQHGLVEGMAPSRDYFDGALRLIRPLCLTREKDLRRFARACDFPTPPPLCPQSDHTRRKLAAGWVEQMERACPQAATNLLRAGLKNLSGPEQKKTPGSAFKDDSY